MTRNGRVTDRVSEDTAESRAWKIFYTYLSVSPHINANCCRFNAPHCADFRDNSDGGSKDHILFLSFSNTEFNRPRLELASRLFCWISRLTSLPATLGIFEILEFKIQNLKYNLHFIIQILRLIFCILRFKYFNDVRCPAFFIAINLRFHYS